MNQDTEFCYPNIIDFFGTTLFHLCHFTEIDLHNYKSYDKYTENNLIKSTSRLSDEVTKIIDKTDEYQHFDIWESYGQDFNELEHTYPSMHRKALVITLYNFLEHQIKTMCSEINKLLPQDMSNEYFKAVCIKRYRQFLIRESGFDINRGNELWNLWEDMLKVEQIRHVLVHSEGEVDNDKKKPLADIQNYCNRRKNIRLIGHRIIIDDGFVAELITDLISLFQLLDKDVFAFIRRYENEHGAYEIPLPSGASRTPL